MTRKPEAALVTGGTRGIGLAVSKKLVSNGIHVVAGYRNNDEAADEALELLNTNKGGSAETRRFDVSEPEEVRDALQDEEFDVLVNNAGKTSDSLLIRMDDDAVEEVVRTNLLGAIYCTREVLEEMMREGYGRIINVTSVAGERGSKGQSNYAASKAGLIGFTRSVARETAGRGITVNAVSPGYIDTQLTSDVQEKNVKHNVPLGRMGKPENVADAVDYLIGADYVTGQVLRVDGGLHMG